MNQDVMDARVAAGILNGSDSFAVGAEIKVKPK